MNLDAFFIILALVEVSVVELIDPCASKQTCSRCIQQSSCGWCSDPTWNSTKSRCSQNHQTCRLDFLINPSSTSKDLLNNPLVSRHDNVSQVVQMSPQEIQLDSRINTPLNVTLKYARAEYPVDLYYLMDLSNSMRDDKDTLSSLGKSLQQLLLNFTSDLRLGFGSFVDKIVGPYTNPTPSELQSPCSGCTFPYGFHNHLKLTDDLEKFSQSESTSYFDELVVAPSIFNPHTYHGSVGLFNLAETTVKSDPSTTSLFSIQRTLNALREIGRANVSGNIDWLEGGFDALMQSIVCHEEIGWRNNVRRVLIFSTDSGFHMAGDGKLGGIVLPNDGECHMENGMYTHSLLQDYPSVSHLSYKVRENAINIIFAVADPQLEAYTYLTEVIEGSKAGSLTANSSNILELVEQQYMKISSSLELQHNAPDNVEVTFYTSCSNATITKSNRCDNLTVGQEVQFKVEVKVLSCPHNSTDWNTTFKIFPIGSHESSLVHLKLNCDCPCEHHNDPNYEENAAECSYNGTYMCGICSCNEMHFGQKCECKSNDLTLTSSMQRDCKADGDRYAADCSGRGVCFCGVCQCDSRGDENEVISGKYCECDNFSCLRGDGDLCGGHGTCECGKCSCDKGWEGKDCMCTTSTVNCAQSNREEICSNHGSCTCGECKCNGGYEGKYCEQEASAAELISKCDELLPCVLCVVHETGNLNPDDCKQNCSNISIEPVDELQGHDGINCVQLTPENCRVQYIYANDSSSEVQVKALSTKDCPTVLAAFYIIFLIVAAILFFGILLLLLWKFIITKKDQREYMRFMKEKEQAKWDEEENPLYKHPRTTYRNPAYGGVYS